jgi:serine/threonine protein kinase/Flp pilus assembly protein TadD
MDAERWKRVDELYHAARERKAEDRASFLAQVCGGDEELRREVESLLGYETETAMFLDRPALEIAARAIAIDRRSGMMGRTLGHYRIESWLGAGGMGEVYRAVDTKLDRAVAVKVLSEHLSTHPEALARFEIEAKAAAALSHPNILAIHDFGEEGGVAYAVTELLHGETLRARLDRSPIEAGETLGIAIAVADGLAAAHARDITHRDIKPENIFLTEDGRVKILDFGVAQMGPLLSGQTEVGPATDSGSLIGTVTYMSPEQAEGRRVDPRSDVFSLGAVVHEMVAGEPAFRRETKDETLTAIRSEEPKGAAKLSGTGLETIVARCLRKEPEQRYASAGKVLAELKELRERPAGLSRWKVVWAAAAGLAAVLAAAWVLLPASRSGTSARRITSLAVLPLNNLSNDSAEEYFADGMTDLLIADLAQVSSLRVISRTSVMQLKGTKKSLPEIARQLNVDGVVEGTVQRSGERVRINAELIDAASDHHLWAKTYDRRVGDVLTLQGEVARAIAREVQAQITPQESGRLSRERTISPAALEAYMKGRFYWGEFTDESLTKSIENYQQATRIDPGYAAAYAGLSEAWTGLGWIGAMAWEDARGPAKDAATKAIALDNSLSDGHAAAAVVAMRDWDWKTAEEEDKLAISLNPGNPTAHMSYGNILRYLGRIDESIAEAKRAVELDPLSALTNEVLAEAYLCAPRPDLTVAQAEAALEVHPEVSELHQIAGWAYAFSGHYDKGIEEIQKSLALDGVDPGLSPDLAYIEAAHGKKEEARKILKRIQTLAKSVPVDPGQLAFIYVGLNERPEALKLLEQAYRLHSPMMTWLKADPRFDPIRNEPGFQDLMRRVGLI